MVCNAQVTNGIMKAQLDCNFILNGHIPCMAVSLKPSLLFRCVNPIYILWLTFHSKDLVRLPKSSLFKYNYSSWEGKLWYMRNTYRITDIYKTEKSGVFYELHSIEIDPFLPKSRRGFKTLSPNTVRHFKGIILWLLSL